MTTTSMANEIAEQPATFTATIDHLWPLRDDIARLSEGRRHILFISRGTSDNAAVFGQYLLATEAGRLATLASPSLATAYGASLDLSDVLAIGISQSGGTQEIVETLDWAKRHGAATIAITNGQDSPLAATADLALVTKAGDELAVPATKTFTAQLGAVAVATSALNPHGITRDMLDDVSAAIAQLLASAPVMAEWATELAEHDRIIVTGRGLASSIALELALKMKEACDVTTVGLSYADLLHGPIALVRPGTPVIVIASETDTAVLAGITEVAARCREAGGIVYGIGGDENFQRECSVALPVTGVAAGVSAIPLIVPGQLLTEALARARGLNPDSPEGLRKVTQTA